MPEEKKSNTKIINSDDVRRAKNNQKKRRAGFFTVLIALTLFLIVVIGMVTGGYEKFLDCVGVDRDVTIRPEGVNLQCTIGTSSLCAAIDDTVIVYDENGVTGYSSKGVWKWNTTCSFMSPVLQSYKNFVLLTDVGGHLIWAFDGDGILWKYNFADKVTGVFVSKDEKNLFVAHEIADFTSAVSMVAIDSLIKEDPHIKYTRKFVSYNTVCVANSNSQVAVTGMYNDVSTVVGTVCLLKGSDGSEYTTQIFDGQIYVKALYLGESNLFLANSNSLVHIKKQTVASGENDSESVVWSRESTARELINIVPIRNDYCVAVYRKANNDTDSNISEIIYYDNNGKEVRQFGIKGDVKGIISRGDTVCLYTEKYVYMFDSKARLIGKYESNYNISNIVYMDDYRVLVQSDSCATLVSYKGE